MIKRKLKWKNFILMILILVFSIIFIISTINIIKWMIDNNKTNKQIDIANNNVEVNEVSDSDNTEIIGEGIVDKSNPYWDYIKMNLIDVNFDDLKKINKDTKGWIQVKGTNINYPFVQASDNDYYLTHSLDKSYNNAGWVFLDYRNNLSDFEKNTIIYAHGRLDTTMFGSLKNILSSGWLRDESNYVVKLSTEYENTLWQVFSVYHIETTSDYIQVAFNNNEEFGSFSSMLINRSAHNFNTSISKNDRILTLSTCYNDKEKVVLHAKLIKREIKKYP